MNERELTSHPPTSGNVRTLILPSGGTMDIPLPGTKARFAIRRQSVLSSPGTWSRVPTILVCLTVGAAIGVGATAWYYSRR